MEFGSMTIPSKPEKDRSAEALLRELQEIRPDLEPELRRLRLHMTATRRSKAQFMATTWLRILVALLSVLGVVVALLELTSDRVAEKPDTFQIQPDIPRGR
jgi:type VI protein secretion system component VasF